MNTLTATQARARLFRLLKQASSGHRQFRIAHREGNAVLLSEEDYESLLETLELLSTPGFAERIRHAREEIERGETFALERILGTG